MSVEISKKSGLNVVVRKCDKTGWSVGASGRCDFDAGFRCCVSGTHYRKLFSVVTVAVFKSRLKTFLFSQAFLLSLLTNTLPGPAPLKLRPCGAMQICLLLLLLFSGAEPNLFLTSSSSITSMERDIDEEIASLQLVINDLEDEITTMQQHFDGELRLVGDRLQDAVCIPPLDSNFAQRFTDWLKAWTVTLLSILSQNPIFIVNCNLCYISFVLFAFSGLILLPSVLWQCWLGSRKGIRPVKNWMVECWCGYLSGSRCRLAYGPVDATATHCLWLL